MGILELSTILITLAAVFTLINIRLLKLPQTIGLMILALCLSVIVAIVGVVFPQVF
jgi:CPA1 family monovalent cation:H+ antiporter